MSVPPSDDQSSPRQASDGQPSPLSVPPSDDQSSPRQASDGQLSPLSVPPSDDQSSPRQASDGQPSPLSVPPSDDQSSPRQASARSASPAAQRPNPRFRRPSIVESAVERQIREAQERGDFDNLPGAGKPLRIESWDSEWGLVFHVLKQAGETLPWIALGQDIDAAQARLERIRTSARGLRGDERARARERYLREAAALDRLLEEFAFQVPTRTLDRGRLPPHVAARQFDATP